MKVFIGFLVKTAICLLPLLLVCSCQSKQPSATDFRTVFASGEWVSVVGAEELIEALPQIRENKNFKYPPELIGQIEKMTIEDNPVLVFYTFR